MTDFRDKLKVGSIEYIEEVLKEAKEDDIVGVDLAINAGKRIRNKRKKK